MTTPPRTIPLLRQFDFAAKRLADRMIGPVVDSGNGTNVEVTPMTDEEYFWEPVPGCLSVRRRSDGPGPQAEFLTGAGDWGRDALAEPPSPAPFTTIAWRLSHLTELLVLRAEYTVGGRTLTRDEHPVAGDAVGAVAAFGTAVKAWREALVGADDAALDTVGHSSYPYGSDPEEPFLEIVWWVNQELLHHGAEIALLRDLHRAHRH
ncbi:DinB family protein [Kitasatospora sp. NPDC051914]|uniref:DinB family protein n=1 Tax=Kitasatospora sp. NPDC051914 TaxID=3154945 RepID=UPI0034293F51